MRKQDFCLCKNKGADQHCSHCKADQRLCFRYTDSTISLLFKSEISSVWPASVTVQVGLCQTWSEIPKPYFSRVAAHLVFLNTVTQLIFTAIKFLDYFSSCTFLAFSIFLVTNHKNKLFMKIKKINHLGE